MIKVLHTDAGKSWSGIENRILIIAKSLNSKSLKVSLALSSKNPLKAKAEKENIECFDLPFKNKVDFLTVLGLKNIILKHKFNVLHVHRSTDHWLAVYAVKLFGLPVKIIRTRHNYTPINPDFFNRLLYNKFSDKIITVADIIKKDITENTYIEPSKVVSIHSSIMIDRFREGVDNLKIRKELGISRDTFLIGMIGRIREHKDYRNFLSACRIIKEKNLSVKFVIVGEGPMEEEIKKLAEELDIGRYVFFLGKRDDIPEILSGLDCFVLSSSVEGSPAVIKEAMLMSKPVVATSVGGIPEIIENGINGILVPSRNPGELADKVMEVLLNKNFGEELGRNARQTIMDRFHPSKLAARTGEVYIGLLNS